MSFNNQLIAYIRALLRRAVVLLLTMQKYSLLTCWASINSKLAHRLTEHKWGLPNAASRS